MGYYFYQDRDTAVLHKFSSSGRQSGAFKHFIDPHFYLKDMMETRMRLILKHARWSMAILPFLDLALAPLVLCRIIKGVYVGRIVKTAHYQQKKLTSKLLLFYIAIRQSIRCYIKGILLLIEQTFYLTK